MKNQNKYAKKWYERYLTIAIGCTILSVSFVIILIYFLLILNFYDKILACFLLIMCLFSSIASVIAFIKCKQIKNDINKKG